MAGYALGTHRDRHIRLVRGEPAAAAAVTTQVGIGMGLAAPALMIPEPDHSRNRTLRPNLNGQKLVRQLFSEPGFVRTVCDSAEIPGSTAKSR